MVPPKLLHYGGIWFPPSSEVMAKHDPLARDLSDSSVVIYLRGQTRVTILLTSSGNAIRGPLGVHQAVRKRYWFYGAEYRLEAQLDYLVRLRKIREGELARFVAGLEMPVQFRPKPRIELPPYDPSLQEFRILDHVRPARTLSGNYWAGYPSCAQQGRDQSGDNLAISIADPRKYKCWAGCTKEIIRAALGHPVPFGRQGRAISVSKAQ
jgi:hypothetical protein